MAVNLRARSEAFPGYKTKWGVEGDYFAAQGTDLDHSLDSDKADGAGFGTDFKNDLPTMRDGTLKISGLASMAPGKVSDVLEDYAGRTAPINIWYCTQGLAVGSPIRMQPSRLMKHSIKAKMKDSVQFDAEFSAAGASDKGFILISPQTLVSGSTFTSAINIAAAATEFGGVVQGHLLALTGGTSPAISGKLQHSDDDGATFTDVAQSTFTINAKGSFRVEIPSTVTINEQTQLLLTITGTPTEIQMIAGFGRGKNPDA